MEKVIYQIRNLINGKLYIGSTKNFKRRKKEHIRSMNSGKIHNSIIQRAWNKYGKDNFIFEIIDYVPEDIDMIWMEEQYVILYDTKNKGYNIQLPFTQQSKSEPSYLNAGSSTLEWINKNGPNNLKKISKEEWLQRRSENSNFKIGIDRKTRKEYNLTLSIPIIGIDINGVILEKFISATEAEKIYPTYPIRECCKKNSKYEKLYTSNNIYWYKEKDFNREKFLNLVLKIQEEREEKRNKKRSWKKEKIIPYSERNIKRIPISIQNIETGEILNFISKAECAKYLNTSESRIHSLTRGWRNKSRGRISKMNTLKGYRYLGTVLKSN